MPDYLIALVFDRQGGRFQGCDLVTQTVDVHEELERLLRESLVQIANVLELLLILFLQVDKLRLGKHKVGA
jgi:hypothetical protein